MTYPKGLRGECMRHSRIRCGECEYVEELEEENKRYKQALEEIESHAVFEGVDWKQEYRELKIIARETLESSK